MTDTARTPGRKLLLVILTAGLLVVPLFAVYLLVYDRQSQSETARAAIAQGWGGAQTIGGPVLAVPYTETVARTVQENGRAVTRVETVGRELLLAPDRVNVHSDLRPERRRKSIHEAVVYEATAAGRASFSLPPDLPRRGVPPERLAFDRAELRFGLSDARGLFGPPPAVRVDGRPLALQPGKGVGTTGGSGFFAPLDARGLRERPAIVDFRLAFRGNGHLSLAPQAGDTRWTVRSAWPHPSFGGGFLPTDRAVSAEGFRATWRVGNLALGRPLVATDQTQGTDAASLASVNLVTPVDLYDQVNRSVKYGFLFIGFTFAMFLLFDVIAGVRVAAPEYLLVGAALVLFFVLLLALAEVVGFAPAYLLASGATITLIAGYSAAVLRSRRRGGYVAALLAGLYATLYVLLSLEAYSLLIGSVLLFAALASIMYLTRKLDWSGLREPGRG